MAHKTIYTVPYRRKRSGKTDYRKRLNLLKGRSLRLVVRRSLSHIQLQVVDYAPTGDKVVVSANSKDLAASGWSVCNANIPEAYLTGLLLAKKAKEAKVKGRIVVDAGLYANILGSKLYAAVKGALDGGLDIPVDEKAFPSEERINGEHIQNYAATLSKDNKDEYNTRFGRYIKAKIDPTKLVSLVEQVKKKIQG